jgi:hypothetical protein
VCPGAGHFGGFVLITEVLDWIAGRWPDRRGRPGTRR